MQKGFLLTLLLSAFAFAEEEADFDPPIGKEHHQVIDQRENYFQTSTPYKIVPKVNPITGDLIEEEMDLAVAGIQPLSVRRFYNHTAPYEPRSGGWRYNPEAYFVANFEWSGQETFAAAGEANGGIIPFKPSSNTCNFNFSEGFSNINPSGQTHPLNTKINYQKAPDKKKGYFSWNGEIVDGSGTKRLFKSVNHCWLSNCEGGTRRIGTTFYIRKYSPNCWTPYQLNVYEERKPNGNIICYSRARWKKNKYYPRPPLLKSITAYNADKTKKLGSITFHHDQDKHGDVRGITAVGSDGRKLAIQHRGSTPILLHAIHAPDKPTATYRYQKSWINRVEKPEDRVITTEYNKAGKVAAQYAPVGPNGEMHPIGRYVYHDNATEVFDAEDNKTIYRFNEHKQFLSLETYIDDKIYRIDRLTWDPSTGNLLKKTIEDSSGKIFQITEYTYDKNHNPIVEKVGDGKQWRTLHRTFSDDGFNLKLSETDRTGKLTRYTYIPNTNLLSSELVYENNNIRQRTFHFYDDCATCIRTILDDGNNDNPNDLTGVTYRKITQVQPKQDLPCMGLAEVVEEKTINALGEEIRLSKIAYTYHPSGQILREDHFDATDTHRYSIHNEYDQEEQLISTTNALGHSTTFTYDPNHNLLTQEGPRPDQCKKYDYDKADRLITIAEKQAYGSFLVSQKKYDKLGRVITEIDDSRFETHYSYDPLGRVITIQYPDGATIQKEYDILDNLVKETDAKGYQTHWHHNFDGQPLDIYYPDGSEEHFTYHPNGTLATHHDQNGSQTIYTYDIFDHPVETKIYSSTGELIKKTSATYSPFCKLSETDGEGETTTYTYDYAGRKIEQQKKNQKTHYFYDSLGRPTQEHKQDTLYEKTYDLQNQLLESTVKDLTGHILRQEKYTYDQAGNRISTENSKGITQTYYENRGLPHLKIDPLGHKTWFHYNYVQGLTLHEVAPNNISTLYLHDSRDNLKEIVKKNTLDQEIQKTQTEFDKNNNRIQETHYQFEGTNLAKTITHTWSYGPLNRLEKFTESGEKQTHYLYDTRGRLQTIIKPNGNELHHEYDDLGRLAHHFSTDFDYHYTYDRNDRLLTIEDKVTKRATTRTYDPLGNITSETIETGFTFSNHYDDHGRRTDLILPDHSKITYTYYADSLYQVKRPPYTITYTKRDLEGNITQIELPTNLTLNIERDPCSRWKKVISPYFSADYSDYDSGGNLCEYTYHDSLGSVTCSYKYDVLDQLITENNHAYVYDSLYNRRKKDLSPYTVDDFCQLLDDGTQVYQYDKNGNLISDGIHHFAYDTQDRLIEIQKGDFRIVYCYDPFHRRLSKQIFHKNREQDTKLYLWDGDNEIGACDQEGQIQELRVLGEGFGAEIGASVLFEFKGKTYVPINDHRGCVVTLIDINQEKPVETYRYTAFGEELTNDVLSPWRFASKRIDEETGLIFFGRRYYCPHLGRWVTPDPQGFDNIPNLYAYLQNSPLTDFDLYGLWSVRTAWRNAQHFMLGMVEGSGYHLYNIASSFGMRDLSSINTWQSHSLLSNQDLAISARGMDWAEQSVLPFTYEARRLGSDVSQQDTMRARGRAFGEQAVTLGGLLSAWNIGKNVLNTGARFQNITRMRAPQELSREYLFSGKVKTPPNTGSGRTKNWLQPNMQAEGAHSVFRRDPTTGKVNHYATYRPQTNLYDPKPWESVLRFDAIGSDPHWNKVLGQDIFAPHIHDPYYPGGIRPALQWEIPR